jgi:hypothetical protein
LTQLGRILLQLAVDATELIRFSLAVDATGLIMLQLAVNAAEAD